MGCCATDMTNMKFHGDMSRTPPKTPQQDDLFKLLFLPEGEYFIMDSEQLVSRPYHDMQGEAMDEGTRRASLSEKLTNVRNKICHNHFHHARERLDREENLTLRGMHETSSKLRYHVKLLDLDRRRHTVEVNKRMQPTKDYSYDDQQLRTTEKRLGVTGPCYYLQRDMRYPVRHTGLQETITPTLAQARKTLLRYKFELFSGSPNLSIRDSISRGSSKRHNSARVETPSEGIQVKGIRRKSWSAHGSISADSDGHSSKKWAFLTQSEESPDISVHHHSTCLGKSLPNLSQSTGSLAIRPTSQHHGPSGHKVKFAFPKKEKSYAKLDAHILQRSKTFHYGTRTPPQRSCYIRDEDDEEPPPRKVDLRALLFGKTPTQSRPSTQASSKRRRSTFNAPGHLTQEMLERESAMIQRKINVFLNKVETWDPTVHFDSDSSSDEGDTPPPYLPRAHVTPFSRHFLSQMADDNREEAGNKQELEKPAETDQGNETDGIQADPDTTDGEAKEGHEGNNQQGEPKPAQTAAEKWKDVAWRITKPNQTQAKKLSTEDIILQRIVGLDVSAHQRRKSGVPLHSASRALRHTPTFKMQKVVEDLMSGRTKFQQFEVDNLKKQLESGVDIKELEQQPEPPLPEPPKWRPGGTNFLPDQLSEVSEDDEEQ